MSNEEYKQEVSKFMGRTIGFMEHQEKLNESLVAGIEKNSDNITKALLTIAKWGGITVGILGILQTGGLIYAFFK